jgi:dienelactone hydrolase
MMDRETTAAAGGPRAAATAGALVLVLHGGRSASREPTTAVQPAVLRMAPFAAAIRRAVRGSGAQVSRPRFTVRGWNGAQAAPAADLAGLLEQASRHYAQVVLVGHSMGARAALRMAGHPLVAAVGALAPWLPPGEPAGQLAGRRVLLAHGDRDRMTSAPQTWAYAGRAAAAGARVSAVTVTGGEHTMLNRAGLWHGLAAEFTRAALGLPPGDARLRALLDQAGPDPVSV